MYAAEFEPAVPARQLPQTKELDRAATGTVHIITQTNVKQDRVYRVKKI